MRTGQKPLLLALLLAASAQAAPLHAQTGQKIDVTKQGAGIGQPVFYPRLVQLSHQQDKTKNGMVLGSFTSLEDGRKRAQIVRFDDDLKPTLVGQVFNELFADGLCCGTLFELPKKVGALPAGTLLWSASIGGENPRAAMQMPIFVSRDQGKNWAYLSNCATAKVSRSGGGLWEPQFIISAKGTLVCYFADETIKGHSQLLQMTETTDGRTWSEPVQIVAGTNKLDRPGMPVVSQLADGRYYMTFEVCGPQECLVYGRHSADGLSWGDKADYGRPIETPEGHRWLHTPVNTVMYSADKKQSTVLVIGQVLIRGNRIDPQNGQAVMADFTGTGNGPWQVLPTGWKIDMTGGKAANVCQNYSTAMLPTGGDKVMMLATDFGGGKKCSVFVAATTLVPPAK